MFVTKKKYDILNGLYNTLEGRYTEICRELREKQEEKEKYIILSNPETEKIKELLDKYELYDQIYSDSENTVGFTILNDDGTFAINGNFELNGKKFYVPYMRTVFSEIISITLEKLSAIEKALLYNDIKDSFSKHIKDERLLRDWKLCFKDVEQLRKPNLKKKVINK